MKVTWGLFTGLLAIVLLLSGGLKAVQTASIVADSPFAIGIGFMVWSLLRSLKLEYAKEHAEEINDDTSAAQKREESEENFTTVSGLAYKTTD